MEIAPIYLWDIPMTMETPTKIIGGPRNRIFREINQPSIYGVHDYGEPPVPRASRHLQGIDVFPIHSTQQYQALLLVVGHLSKIH